MRYLLLLTVLVAAPVWADEERAEPAEPESATVTRRLSEFPAGHYVMVQAFDEKVRHTLETGGQDMKEQKSRIWNRLTFDLEVTKVKKEGALRTEAHVTVRRVQFGIEGKQDLAYDSDGEPDQQAEVLRRQFRYLVGGQASVDLAAFDEGAGFTGMNAVWDAFLEDHPQSVRMAESNRKNFGDSRFDRMFERGLPLLFGPEAGRAAGRTRELTKGENFDWELEVLGIGREKAMSKHTVEVVSIGKGYAELVATWAENGFNPKTDGGAVLMRGGDLKGRYELRVHLASGLPVSLTITEQRMDQTCGMDMVQRTRHASTVSKFSILPK